MVICLCFGAYDVYSGDYARKDSTMHSGNTEGVREIIFALRQWPYRELPFFSLLSLRVIFLLYSPTALLNTRMNPRWCESARTQLCQTASALMFNWIWQKTSRSWWKQTVVIVCGIECQTDKGPDERLWSHGCLSTNLINSWRRAIQVRDSLSWTAFAANHQTSQITEDTLLSELSSLGTSHWTTLCSGHLGVVWVCMKQASVSCEASKRSHSQKWEFTWYSQWALDAPSGLQPYSSCSSGGASHQKGDRSNWWSSYQISLDHIIASAKLWKDLHTSLLWALLSALVGPNRPGDNQSTAPWKPLMGNAHYEMHWSDIKFREAAFWCE